MQKCMKDILIAVATKNKAEAKEKRKLAGIPEPEDPEDRPDPTLEPLRELPPRGRPSTLRPTYPRGWKASEADPHTIQFPTARLPSTTRHTWRYDQRIAGAIGAYLAKLHWPNNRVNPKERGEASWIELAIDFELTEGIPIPYLPKAVQGEKSPQRYLIPGEEGAKEHSTLTAQERGRIFSSMVASFEKRCGRKHEGEPVHTRTLTSIGHKVVRGLSARPTFVSEDTDAAIMRLPNLNSIPTYHFNEPAPPAITLGKKRQRSEVNAESALTRKVTWIDTGPIQELPEELRTSLPETATKPKPQDPPEIKTALEKGHA